MEALVRCRLSGKEIRAVLFIMNQTDGYLREEDTIKPAFWEERANIPKSNLSHTLARLRDWKVISQQKYSFKVNPPRDWDPQAFIKAPQTANSSKMTKPKLVEIDEALVEIDEALVEIDEKQLCTKRQPSKRQPSKRQRTSKGNLPTISFEHPDPQVTEIRKALEERLGYPSAHIARDQAEIKRALKLGYTKDQILDCWEKMKSFEFWQGKELPWAKVVDNLGEFVAGRLREYHNGRTRRVEARTNPEDFKGAW